MNRYENFTEFDFIADEKFKDWVLNPTKEKDYFWESWVKNYPEKRETIEFAKEFILSLNLEDRSINISNKDKVYTKIIEGSKQSSSRDSNQNSFHFYYPRYAAAIILFLIGSFLVYQKINYEEEIVHNKTVQYIEREALKGEKLSIKLPDGSKVKLNSGSKIKFPKQFKKNRNLVLEGECFFEVARDTLHPFKIKTGKVSTQVLGTSFNIKSNSATSIVSVSVVSGKVSVSKDNDQVVLSPKEYITYGNNYARTGYFNYNDVIGWKDGLLIFKDANLKELKEKLENWYGCEIEIINTQHHETNFTGIFENKSLKEVLEGLKYTSHINYKIDDKKVFIELNANAYE